jgi:hypothetical protein
MASPSDHTSSEGQMQIRYITHLQRNPINQRVNNTMDCVATHRRALCVSLRCCGYRSACRRRISRAKVKTIQVVFVFTMIIHSRCEDLIFFVNLKVIFRIQFNIMTAAQRVYTLLKSYKCKFWSAGN